MMGTIFNLINPPPPPPTTHLISDPFSFKLFFKILSAFQLSWPIAHNMLAMTQKMVGSSGNQSNLLESIIGQASNLIIQF